jgi:hypothetical protein
MDLIPYLSSLQFLERHEISLSSVDRRLDLSKFKGYIPEEARTFVEEKIEKIIEGVLESRIVCLMTEQDQLISETAEYLQEKMPKEIKPAPDDIHQYVALAMYAKILAQESGLIEQDRNWAFYSKDNPDFRRKVNGLVWQQAR